MMAAAAFNQAQSSLRWFIDNFSALADWRATLLRVASFRRALLDSQEQMLSDTVTLYKALGGGWTPVAVANAAG